MLALLPLLIPAVAAQYTATYTWGQLPDKTEGDGQTGTNNCGTRASQTSMCQNVVINSASDFCLWGPPGTDPSKNAIGQIEEIVVAYCLNDGYGTRLLPSGTITSAHFVKVMSDYVSYVQVTGNGDFTKINIPAGDDGGELDPHSWTGLGNPQGGLVFTKAFTGQYEQTHEWMSFQSASNFCLRACRDGPNGAGWCPHIYDVMGCGMSIPGSFDNGFDDCNGSPAEQPGVYGGSTFYQGQPFTPAPHPPGPTSQCTAFSTVGGASVQNNAAATTTVTSASSSPSSMSASASMTSAMASSSAVASASSMSMSTSMSMSVSASAASSASGPARQSSSTPPSGASAAAAATSSGAADKRTVAGMGVGVLGLVMAMAI